MFLSARSVATSRTLGPIRQRFGTMDDPPINSPSACCRSPQVALSESLASVARLSFGYPPAAHPSNDGILDRRFVECLGSCPRQQSPHCRQLPCKLAGVGACTYARARARIHAAMRVRAPRRIRFSTRCCSGWSCTSVGGPAPGRPSWDAAPKLGGGAGAPYPEMPGTDWDSSSAARAAYCIDTARVSRCAQAQRGRVHGSVLNGPGSGCPSNNAV